MLIDTVLKSLPKGWVLIEFNGSLGFARICKGSYTFTLDRGTWRCDVDSLEFTGRTIEDLIKSITWHLTIRLKDLSNDF